jgi:hypothetical protein
VEQSHPKTYAPSNNCAVWWSSDDLHRPKLMRLERAEGARGAAWPTQEVRTGTVVRAVVTSDGVRGAAASVASLLAPARSTIPKCGQIEFSPDGPEDRRSDFLPVVQAHLCRNDQCQNQRRAFLERARASPSLAVNSMRPKLVHAYLHADISQAIKPLAIARLNKLPVLVTDSTVRTEEASNAGCR